MSDLDEMLRRYLEREEQDPIRKRLEASADWQMKHDQKDEERHIMVVRALDGHNFRLQSLEQKADRLEEHAEDTGEHELAELRERAKTAEHRLKEQNDRRRNFWLSIGGSIVATLVAAMLLAHFGVHP